jgi:hypothetical protein
MMCISGYLLGICHGPKMQDVANSALGKQHRRPRQATQETSNTGDPGKQGDDPK